MRGNPAPTIRRWAPSLRIRMAPCGHNYRMSATLDDQAFEDSAGGINLGIDPDDGDGQPTFMRRSRKTSVLAKIHMTMLSYIIES